MATPHPARALSLLTLSCRSPRVRRAGPGAFHETRKPERLATLLQPLGLNPAPLGSTSRQSRLQPPRRMWTQTSSAPGGLGTFVFFPWGAKLACCSQPGTQQLWGHPQGDWLREERRTLPHPSPGAELPQGLAGKVKCCFPSARPRRPS